MGWAILVVIAYLPIFFQIFRRLRQLEDENRHLEKKVYELQTEIGLKKDQ